jgi:hypothetical protein
MNTISPIMKKDEPVAKQLKPSPLSQPQDVLPSNVSTFELLPKLKGMALTPPLSQTGLLPQSSFSTTHL